MKSPIELQLLLAVMLCFPLSARTTVAPTANITGTTVGAPTAVFPLLGSTSGSCVLNKTAEPYRLYTVTTDVKATITATITNIIDAGGNIDDTGLFWYEGTFKPSAGCTNFSKIGNDRSGANLTFTAFANTTYILAVVGLFGSADDYAMTLTIPTGNITVSVVSPVLPVDLLSFGGYTEGGKNHLVWATASEINAAHFNVERSADGLIFEKIGSVKAKGSNAKYGFIDNSPFPNLNYYKLETNDLDGKTAASKIISLLNSKTGKGLNIYPNPVVSELIVVCKDGISCASSDNYQISNLLGQVILRGPVQQRIDVSLLAQGAYLLRVGTEQVKFMK